MDSGISAQKISQLMTLFRQGDRRAADDLIELFHPELRRLANARMRNENKGHSWQPTLLVNELYLELVKIKALLPPENAAGADSKAAFFGLAASLMKRLLIHHARPLSAKAIKLELGQAAMTRSYDAVAEIEIALSRLETIRPRLRAILELKVFEGMTLQQISNELGCSTATVTREWSFTQHWLQKELPSSVLR